MHLCAPQAFFEKREQLFMVPLEGKNKTRTFAHTTETRIDAKGLFKRQFNFGS